MTAHVSDCASSNEPAYPAAPCDCGSGLFEAAIAVRDARMDCGHDATKGGLFFYTRGASTICARCRKAQP